MFEEFLGLPLHPLAVHAPVVLVPLLALAAAAYVLVPSFRARVEWLAVLLAVAAPVAAVVAKLSGDALGERTYQDQLPEAVTTHSGHGNRLLWSALALGVLTLALVAVRRGGPDRQRGVLGIALSGLVLIAAAASLFFVIRAGHTGAEMVWFGR